MPSGDTFVTDVSEGLDTIIAAARSVREYPNNIMPRLVDTQSLPEGTGTAWREFAADQLTASNYGEADTIDNPQQIDGSVLTGTPQLVAIQTFIGDRVRMRLNRKAFGTFGQLAQNAIQRRKDIDGLAVFAGAGTTLAGTGVTLTSGHVMAGIERIEDNSVEPGAPPYYVVLHGRGSYDLMSEIIAGVGTYPIPAGMTESVFRQGFKGSIDTAELYVDGLITVDATPDARGAVFSRMAIVLVQGKSPWTETRREPQKGYGGDSVWLKDEYVYVERSAGRWLYGLLHDATAPTS